MSCHFHVDAELSDALRVAGIANGDDLLDLQVDDKPRNVVTPCKLSVAGTVGRFHLKRYVYGLRRGLRMAGRGTFWGHAPEVSEFRALKRLRELGVPAVRPVAAAARTRFGVLVAHALLTEHVPGAADLGQRFATPDDPLRTDASLRVQVVELMGRHLATMHGGGFVHRDLFARNVLLRIGQDGAELTFLDCRRGGPPTHRHGPRYDLECFAKDPRLLRTGGFSVEELKRMLAVYADAMGIDVPNLGLSPA